MSFDIPDNFPAVEESNWIEVTHFSNIKQELPNLEIEFVDIPCFDEGGLEKWVNSRGNAYTKGILTMYEPEDVDPSYKISTVHLKGDVTKEEIVMFADKFGNFMGKSKQVYSPVTDEVHLRAELEK